MPDGSKIVPEVEIIDVQGDQVGRKYRTVRIRAEREIELNSVYWTGFIIKNMP